MTLALLPLVLIGVPQAPLTEPPPAPAPPRCRYQEERGVDTWVGMYQCQAGLKIEHDIGDLAGVRVQNTDYRQFSKIESRYIHNHKILFGFTKAPNRHFVVSIPDFKANFEASGPQSAVRNSKDLVIAIARDFVERKSKGQQ